LLLVLVLVFALRGWIRGFLSQLCAVVGVLAALWLVGWLASWVGVHWVHARPTIVFGLLRVLVVVLAGTAVISLFRWLGEVSREAARAGPLAFFEGPGGLVMGAMLGLVFVTVLMFVALHLPWPAALPRAAARSRSAMPLMSAGAEACDAARRFGPGWEWLRNEFRTAEHRALLAHRATSI